ncbi:MAG: hypothetical protein HUU02_15860 [Bacteroidetes bacterium]|nr:hypothetical protein [Bacteroidota bacterium]
MKNLLAAALFALILVGCDNSSPVEADQNSDALYSETSMLKTTQATDDEIRANHGSGPMHDSLRHARMLNHLKTYVGLSDAQFDSVKIYAQTLFAALNDIRTQVKDSTITRDEAKELVVAARAQFVASVTLIITEEQTALFTEWVEKFWNKKPGRKGPGGRGGHGHGGPGFRP